MWKILAPLMVLTLVACETAPARYGPASGPTSPGFSQMRIEQNRFRVTYRGAPGQPPAMVEDMALLRAADIATGEGYDWFRVTNRYGEVTGGGGPTLSLGTGSTSFGRRSAVGVGLGTSFQLGGGPARAVTLEVALGKGAKPSDPDAYDAADVQRNLHARLG